MRRYGSGARGPGLLIGVACVVLFVILLAYSCGGVSSGAAHVTPLTAAPDRAAVGHLPPAGRRHCSSARKGFVWYRAQAARWYRQMGAGSRGVTATLPRSCYEWRYGAKRERLRARIALREYRQWRREMRNPSRAICHVFGDYCSQALRVASCESGRGVWARNGQYLGMFQMGSYARGRYGHAYTPLGQARAAYAYFVASGRDWSPWSCKP